MFCNTILKLKLFFKKISPKLEIFSKILSMVTIFSLKTKKKLALIKISFKKFPTTIIFFKFSFRAGILHKFRFYIRISEIVSRMLFFFFASLAILTRTFNLLRHVLRHGRNTVDKSIALGFRWRHKIYMGACIFFVSSN